MLNKVIQIGRLTQETELRYTPNGVAVCTIRIAVDRPYKKDEADFFEVECWRKTAEAVSKHLDKGDPVAIDGWLKQDRYEVDGHKRTAYKVVAEKVQFLPRGGKKDVAAKEEVEEIEVDNDDTDVPF